MKFKPGDVVFLKSGGPGMTVESVRPCGDVECVWMDAKDELQSESFNPLCLKPAAKEETAE